MTEVSAGRNLIGADMAKVLKFRATPKKPRKQPSAAMLAFLGGCQEFAV